MQCKCGKDAVKKITEKEGPNKGREFWTCEVMKTKGGCGFFEWADGEPNKKPQGEKRKWEGKGNSNFKPYKKPWTQGGGSSSSPVPRNNEEPVSKPSEASSNAEVERKLALKLMMDRLEKLEEDNGNFKTCYKELRALREELKEFREANKQNFITLTKILTEQKL